MRKRKKQDNSVLEFSFIFHFGLRFYTYIVGVVASLRGKVKKSTKK